MFPENLRSALVKAGNCGVLRAGWLLFSLESVKQADRFSPKGLLTSSGFPLKGRD
jgi:hypothetical protein